MSADRFLNALKGHMENHVGGLGQPRAALVESYDPQTATAKVTIQPEGIMTGWLPVLTQWAGQGWGLIAPLQQHDQVLVIPQEGDIEHGVIVGRYWSDVDYPPTTPAVGEFWLVHKSGSFLKLMSDGTIQIKGDLHVTGSVIATGEMTAKSGGSPVSLSTHRHDGVQAGSSQSGAPHPGT